MRVPMKLPQKIVPVAADADRGDRRPPVLAARRGVLDLHVLAVAILPDRAFERGAAVRVDRVRSARSEEHTSELQSHSDLVCRLLLEKKKKKNDKIYKSKKKRVH